jgi:hypothetical protein
LYLARQQRARQDAAHFAFSSGIAAFANGTVAPHTKMDRAVGLPVWRATTPSTTNCALGSKPTSLERPVLAKRTFTNLSMSAEVCVPKTLSELMR